MISLTNKRAVITGAAQGIGKATAELFSARGARVIALDSNRQGLESVPADERVTLDLTRPDHITHFASSLSPVDILFNCAGYVHSGNILECDEKAWRDSFAINVDAIYHLTKAILPGMLSRGGGSIINMASVASSITGVGNRFAYGATKAAVIGMTKSIAHQFIGQGIRCNAICPGTVQSPSLEQRMASQGDYHRARSAFIARQPMGRLGKPEEIAELAAYLASDAAGFTTGQIHVIDGGWTL